MKKLFNKAPIVAAFLTWNALPADSEVIPGTRFDHGYWAGAAYSDDYSGEFSHCVVSAEYVSGDILYLSVTSGATVVVGVGNPSFRFTVGESFPVSIYIDRRRPFHARANAGGSDFVTLEISDFDRGMTAIQRGINMRIVSDKFTGNYSLQGTSRALDKALRCAVDNLDYVDVSPAPQDERYESSIAQAVFYQIATQMITTIDARDFRYLSNKEIESLGFPNGVFWISEELDVLGGTLALPMDEESLQRTDASDVAFMSSLCEGDFASQAKSIDTSNMNQREVSGFCIEDTDRSQYVAVKTQFGDEVLYNVMFFGSNAPASPVERDEFTGNIALKAASFVLDN